MTKAFVVGHPIKHSRSPLIHGYWLHQHGLDGSYERIDVAPADFPAFLRSFGQQGFAGGNVTIPHKETAFAGVDRRTERAERVRAVNTVWVEDGILWGDNTDVAGFVDNLDVSLGTGWEQSVGTVLVIGAGGGARAVVAGLQDRAFERIAVINRTPAKARELVAALSSPAGPALEAASFADRQDLIRSAGLIVNTTSLGMEGQPALDIDLAEARPDAIVTDIVYVPLKTPLLRAAEARGLRVVTGLGMLLHQAVPGFSRWFGVTPVVTPELETLILGDIGNTA
jgi:shikimate dehydrogenase